MVVDRLEGVDFLSGLGQRNGQELLDHPEQGGIGDRLPSQLSGRQLADQSGLLGGDQHSAGDDHGMAPFDR
jgi:hypothetical protein